MNTLELVDSKGIISYFPVQNERRLICNSVTTSHGSLTVVPGFVCCYGPKCSYAHSNQEQKIDERKMSLYEALLGKLAPRRSSFSCIENIRQSPADFDDIYRGFVTASSKCDRCFLGTCTGGYNCRNGACCQELLVCREDLLSGKCPNPVQMMTISEPVRSKFSEHFDLDQEYPACSSGHHLTLRGIPSYSSFLLDTEKRYLASLGQDEKDKRHRIVEEYGKEDSDSDDDPEFSQDISSILDIIDDA